MFRRFALALAAAQLLAYAVAPVLEASTERSSSAVTIESRHSATCVQIHQASTCLACQLLTLTAQQGHAVALPCADRNHIAFRLFAEAVSPRAPPLGPLSRAPPTLA